MSILYIYTCEIPKLKFLFPCGCFIREPTGHTTHIALLSFSHQTTTQKEIQAPPPCLRVAVVIEGAGLHRLWGGLTFGRVWEAADVRVGQDVCKSSPGSCFSAHSDCSLAAATTLNSKHTGRHNLSVLTSSLTHKVFVNIICRHVYEWASAHRPVQAERELSIKHTHQRMVYVQTNALTLRRRRLLKKINGWLVCKCWRETEGVLRVSKTNWRGESSNRAVITKVYSGDKAPYQRTFSTQEALSASAYSFWMKRSRIW